MILTEPIKDFLFRHNSLFYTFINEMVEPVYTEEIPTAAVWFNKDGSNFKFGVNPEFWNELNFFSQCFLISHEILHVFLKHGIRGRKFLETQKKQSHLLLNKSQDISINEMLIARYGFDYESLNFPFDMCLVETCFSMELIQKYNISYDESFDYYYRLVVDNEDIKMSKKPQTLDQHDNEKDKNSDKGDESEDTNSSDESDSDGEQQDGDSESDVVDDFLSDNDVEVDSDKELEDILNDFNEQRHPDNNLSSDSFIIENTKGLTDYFKIAIKTSIHLKKHYTDKSVWHGYDRRISPILSSIDPNIVLPTPMETENYSKDKHELLIYIDISGSCKKYWSKFTECILNLPLSKFNFEMFSFSDQVDEVEIDYKNKTAKLSGFGGTNIDAVINHSNDYLKHHSVDAIFILTDGEFKNIRDEKFMSDKKWFWFLVPSFFDESRYTDNTIPENHHIFKFNDL